MNEFVKRIIKLDLVINSLKIALFVGVILNVVNQGMQILDGLEIVWWQVIMNFVVPYCVASYSAVRNEVTWVRHQGQ